MAPASPSLVGGKAEHKGAVELAAAGGDLKAPSHSGALLRDKGGACDGGVTFTLGDLQQVQVTQQADLPPHPDRAPPLSSDAGPSAFRGRPSPPRPASTERRRAGSPPRSDARSGRRRRNRECGPCAG